MMKTRTLTSRALAAALLFAAAAPGLPLLGQQTEATTDPVGLIELSVQGGSAASPKLSLISPTLTRPVLWQGAITTISGTTITVSGVPWSTNQFNGAAGSHYVELFATSNTANAGTLSDITGTTDNTITTGDDLSTRAAIGDTIKIRRDVTISDLFGANNTAGLLASSSSASTADEVLIYNGASFISYFYYTGPGLAAGWYRSTNFAPSNNVSIAPNEAVVIKRKTSGDLTITFAGAVKTGNTLIPILDGLNVLGTASANGLTLATSGLYTGNQNTGVKPSSSGASTADEIILYSATGQKNYFYYTGPGLPAGWYASSTFAAADNIAIAPGTAFVLKRKSGVAFNWSLPSPTSF